MADQNAILTSLGLDTTQYEDGINRAAQATQAFVQIGNQLDQSIRQIPVIGQVWEATGGKIVDGFVAMKTEARDFARIMQKDVSGSLSGTIEKLGEVQDLIRKGKNYDFGRNLAEGSNEALNNPLWLRSLYAKITGGTYESKEQKRENMVAQLEKERPKLIQQSLDLMEKQDRAQSSILSGSQKQSELDRLSLDIANRRVEAAERENALFGPSGDRSPELQAKALDFRAQRQKEITELSERETEAINARAESLEEQNKYQVESAKIATSHLPIDQARLDVAHALKEVLIATNGLDEEAVEAASAKLQIAQQGLRAAQREKEYRDNTLSNDTKLSKLNLTGSAHDIRSQEIRSKYGPSINAARDRGDTALAESLVSRAGDEISAEQTRNRLLGSSGRSEERRQARFNARQERINKTFNSERQKTQEKNRTPLDQARGGAMPQDDGSRQSAQNQSQGTLSSMDSKLSQIVTKLGN